jgi:hypothetical protein
MLWKQRWVAAGLAGAAAAAAYPPGLVLALPAAVWPLVANNEVPLWERVRNATVTASLVATGTGLVVLVQYIQTGRWNAYLLAEGHYGHTFQEPLAPARAAVAQLRGDGLFAGLTVAPAYQTVLVTLAVALALAVAVRERHRLAAGEALVAVWLVPAWVVANFQTNVTTYRAEGTLLPAVVLLAKLPRPIAVAFGVAAACVSVPIALLFIRNILT